MSISPPVGGISMVRGTMRTSKAKNYALGKDEDNRIVLYIDKRETDTYRPFLDRRIISSALNR
jgi:hypothetical protein